MTLGSDGHDRPGMDTMLPEMDGHETLKQIRAAWNNRAAFCFPAARNF